MINGCAAAARVGQAGRRAAAIGRTSKRTRLRDRERRRSASVTAQAPFLGAPWLQDLLLQNGLEQHRSAPGDVCGGLPSRVLATQFLSGDANGHLANHRALSHVAAVVATLSTFVAAQPCSIVYKVLKERASFPCPRHLLTVPARCDCAALDAALGAELGV